MAFLVSAATPARAVEATLIADAHVSTLRPTANSGSLSNVNVGGGYTGLIQFDLGLLPSGTTASQVSRAVLRLYVNRMDTPGLVTIQPLNGSWAEASVTSATLPALGSATQNFSVVQAGGFVAVDVTTMVQGWIASPASNHGFALTADTAVLQFDSKENDQTAHPAALDVGIVSQGPAGQAGATGPAGAAGPTGATGPAGPAGPAGASTVARFAYQGTYEPATAYALNDVVVYQGSSYLSLVGQNRGNTPGSSAQQWGLLAQGSAPGSTGTTATSLYQGTYASTQSYGLNAIVTYQGVSYISLQSGNTGNSPDRSGSAWGILAQGLPGPAGPQGPQGVPGLNYAGTYGSTANYGLNDVVVYQGSSYLSLVSQNHGNTPGQNPGLWSVLAQAGTPGAAGAAGPAGAQGLPGPQGPQGLQGPPGATGATGVQGAPGLTYQGNYQSTVNYKLGDVVLWQGTTYTSLAGENHGNTPDASPANWGVLSARGPAGAAGATGAPGPQGPQGLPGSVGPPGERGPQGLQGVAGQAGAQGLTGATGPQGLQGPAGPQGVAGPVGLTFRGAYQSTVNYGLADGVSYNGAGYVSLVAGNHGNTPDQSPSAWSLFAAAGAAGATGAVGPAGPAGALGPQGPAGPQGAAGAVGATGPQGPAVVNYTGNYASTTNYASRDAVSYGGSTYVSLVDGNHGNTPGLTQGSWAVLAAQGAAGPQGAAGSAGAAGAAGAAGPAGPPGAVGPPITFAGGWLTGTAYPVGTGVSYGGSSYVALVANSGRQPDVSPQYWGVLAQAGAAGPAGPTGVAGAAGAPGAAGATGATGPAGPSGPSGAAAIVAVGSVTTAAAGSPAMVTNSGTSSAAVLNFVIPQGAAGANGSGGGGAQALSGIPFVSTYHSVSFNANFYSVNGSASAYTEGTGVLTWVPGACTVSRLTVFSQQENTITVSLRLGSSPGAIADAGLSCTVSSGTSCTAMGSVAVAAGSFVDFRVTGTSGNAAAVWTALQCD